MHLDVGACIFDLDVAGRRRRELDGCMATVWRLRVARSLRHRADTLRARAGAGVTYAAPGRLRVDAGAGLGLPASSAAQGVPGRRISRSHENKRKSTSTTIWGIELLDSGTVGHVLHSTVACAHCRCGVGAHSQTPHRRCRGAGIVSARWEPLRIGHPLAQLDARPRALT